VLSSVFVSSLRVGLDTLRTNPLRTLLSTLGVIMGVAALVAVLSLGDGVEHYARKQIERTTDLQTISITSETYRFVDGQPFQNVDVPRFGLDEARSLQTELGAGTNVVPLVMGASLARTRGDTGGRGTQVVGTTSAVQAVRGLRMERGRFFNEMEERDGTPVVVLTRALAVALSSPPQPRDTLNRSARSRPAARSLTPDAAALVGDTLYFQGKPRVVLGILGVDEDDPTSTRERIAFMPFGAANEATAATLIPRTPNLIVKIAKVEEVSAVRRRVEGWLGEKYGNWKGRVAVGTNEMRVEQVERGMLVFKLLMGALTGISLIVGGIGIMNVLLASVVERTREIGIRKATGARRRHILLQFLTESVTISGVGAVIGVVLGLTASFSITALMRMQTNAPVYAWVSVSTVAIAVLASVAVGLAFGIYPALTAARLSPIDAIHRD
jgi:putative ABC transport system permease protein